MSEPALSPGDQAALKRVTERLYSLSMALLRVETVRATGRSFAQLLPADPEQVEALYARLPTDVDALRQNNLLQASNLMMVQLGLLYGLVEAWGKWHFSDPRVNELLKSPFVEDLRRFRNAVFHVSLEPEERVMRWAEEPAHLAWSQEVETALRDAILDWDAHFGERVQQNPRVKEF